MYRYSRKEKLYVDHLHMTAEVYLWIDRLSDKVLEHISIFCLGSHKPGAKSGPRLFMASTAIMMLGEHVSVVVTVHWRWFGSPLPLPSSTSRTLNVPFAKLKHVWSWRIRQGFNSIGYRLSKIKSVMNRTVHGWCWYTRGHRDNENQLRGSSGTIDQKWHTK